MVDPGDLWRGTPGHSRTGGGATLPPRHTATAAEPRPAEILAADPNPTAGEGGLFGAPRHALSAGLFGGGPQRLDLHPRPPPTGAFTRRTYEGGENIDIRPYMPHAVYRRRASDPRDPLVGELGAFAVLAAHSFESLQAQSISTFDPYEDETAAETWRPQRPFFFDNSAGGGLHMEPPAHSAQPAAPEVAAPTPAAADGQQQAAAAAAPPPPLRELFTSASFRKRAALLSRTARPLSRVGAILSCAVSIAVAVLWSARLPVFLPPE